MEFHQLARVVFVQALAEFGLGVGASGGDELDSFRGKRIGADAAGVVEIEQHGWTVRGGFEEVFEFAERERADDVPFEADEVVGHLAVLVQEDVEVIEPEIGHHFLQLGGRVDVVCEALGDELLMDEALRVFEIEDSFAQIGCKTGKQGSALHGFEGFEEAVEVLRLHRGEVSDALLRWEIDDAAQLGFVDGQSGVRSRVDWH